MSFSVGGSRIGAILAVEFKGALPEAKSELRLPGPICGDMFLLIDFRYKCYGNRVRSRTVKADRWASRRSQNGYSSAHSAKPTKYARPKIRPDKPRANGKSSISCAQITSRQGHSHTLPAVGWTRCSRYRPPSLPNEPSSPFRCHTRQPRIANHPVLPSVADRRSKSADRRGSEKTPIH